MIFKRQKIWWLEKTIDGRRIRESLSTTSKRDAQKLAEIRIAEILEHPSAVEKKKKNYTFAALYALWEDRVLPFRKSPANSQEKFWLDHFGDRPVVEIRRDEIERVLSTLTRTPRSAGGQHASRGKVKPATRNRYLAAIRSLLRYAYKWEWIDSVPRLPDIVPENNARNTWATKAQAAQLIAALERGCRETALAARFALATGGRMGGGERLGVALHPRASFAVCVRGCGLYRTPTRDRHRTVEHDLNGDAWHVRS
jgi:hypothetical protein